MHFGIDYGGQLNGTTAVCMEVPVGLIFLQSQKNKSADDFLVGLSTDYPPAAIYIDAPLSLPPAFTDVASDDFFYRAADAELKAMSPMFLGGLTARAMRLKRTLEAQDIPCYETYPKALLREMFHDLSGYKRESAHIDRWTDAVLPSLPVLLHMRPANWHQFDALLCWLSGYRHRAGRHQSAGNTQEGLIIF